MKGARKPDSWYRQSGVIAVRAKDGAPQVLLVTSAGIMVVLRAQSGSPAVSPGTVAAGDTADTDRQLEVVLADGADLPAPGPARR